MAETVNINGAVITRRNPWGVWALSLVTAGIYGIVWWFKINKEMRDYSAAVGKPIDNNPTTAVLALIPGGILVVPAVITYLHTARRAREIQAMTSGGTAVEGVSGALVVVLALVGGFHTIYLQSALNAAYARATGTAPAIDLVPSAA